MRSVLTTLAILLIAVTAQAATFTVYPDGSGDYPTIQDAIDDAASGDTIQLGNGTFSGQGNRDLDNLGMELSLVSLSDDPTLCVIDCAGSSGNPHFGILFSGQGPTTLLRSIAIINGYSNGYGGAVLLDVASPTIENCIFQNNYAYQYGGAVSGAEVCSPVIRNCIFRDNTADYYGQGGALYFLENSTPLIEGCTFEGNNAGNGGAIFLSLDSTVTVSGCTFYGNTGSAIAVGAGSFLAMDTSILVGNTNYAVQAYGTGGTAQLSCCDLFGNTGANWSGIIAGQGSINNNMEENPFFIHAEFGYFSLFLFSPCAAQNNASCGQIGAWGVISPMVISVAPGGLYTIQDALDLAFSGDTVELEDGTYTGDGNRDLTFLGKTITVRSASGDPRTCVIDCQATASDQHRGFSISGGQDNNASLQGLTIKSGYSGGGAAVLISGSSPTLRNCIFTDNLGTQGAGVSINNGSPVISECEFRDNHFNSLNGSGGGVSVDYGSVWLEGCHFLSNGSGEFTGALSGGGAIHLNNLTDDVLLSNCTFTGNSANWGGAVYQGQGNQGFISQFSHCTFADNSSNNGSVFNVGDPAVMPMDLSSSLIVGNHGDTWLNLDFDGIPAVSCSNVYGNEGGDWAGVLADLAGQDGNMSLNPRFCDPASGDYNLEATSPCLVGAPDNPTCGTMGALGVGCDFRGLITGVTDVPNDQGRRVRVSWDASAQDVRNAEYPITGYSIWRLIDDPVGKAILPAEGQAHRELRFPSGDWDYLATVPARGEQHYSTFCETVADSTVAGGMHLSTFFVSAETADPTFYFDSEPASGYSVDNLAPSAPGNLRLQTPDLLAWDEVTAPDFNYFTAYGSQSETMDGSAVQLGTTVDLTLDLQGAGYRFYLVTATDFNGNEGQPAVVASGISGVGDGSGSPTRFALYPAWPNPGTGSTTFSFDLPRASRVDLAVYDLAGRKVATLVSAEMPAGTHLVPWNGRVNGTEGPLASGVYFYRLRAGQFSDSGRVVILK